MLHHTKTVNQYLSTTFSSPLSDRLRVEQRKRSAADRENSWSSVAVIAVVVGGHDLASTAHQTGVGERRTNGIDLDFTLDSRRPECTRSEPPTFCVLRSFHRRYVHVVFRRFVSVTGIPARCWNCWFPFPFSAVDRHFPWTDVCLLWTPIGFMKRWNIVLLTNINWLKLFNRSWSKHLNAESNLLDENSRSKPKDFK